MATTTNNDILKQLKLHLREGGDTASHQDLTHFFPAIIYVYESDKKKLHYINGHRINIDLGYSPDEVEAWEDDLSNLVFKDDLEIVKQELERYHTLEDDDEHSYQCRLNHKAGDWRYYRTRGVVLRRNEEHKASSLLFLAEDITEKKKYENETYALKKLIDDTEDLLSFGSWSWDATIDRLYWTDGMYKLLGYHKEDVQANISNEFFMKHVSEKDAPVLLDMMNCSIRNKTDFECTYSITTKANVEKTVSTKAKIVLLPGGEVGKVLGITRDITDQVKINKDLVHYKEMILEKEEFLNQGSWETDLLTGETSWSKGMYRLFGYSVENASALPTVTNELHYSFMTEEDAIQHKTKWDLVLHEQDNFTRETTITDINGITKKLETYGKVIKDKNGKAQKVIGTTRDVTRLREYEKSLEEKIQELNRSNTELEEFAYIASHDLQEPLRKLTTFSERLQSKFSVALGKEGITYLERIVTATQNMRVLIDNLLEFSRTARSGKHFVKMDLSKILEEVKADLELKIEETGTIIYSPSLPTLELIPSQVKQLFDNLLSNSIKFKKRDHHSIITISCKMLTHAEKVSFFLHNEKNYYKILIEDNGIGFEKEYAERIFQIFQRLHGKSEYPGSGIGLAICKKIVENHNGIIFASAEPGVGSVFTVILPENQ